MNRLRALASAALLFSAYSFVSCSSGGDGADAGVDQCMPPLSYPGNERHVGAGCTPGGNQCAAWGEGNAQFCAIDLDPEGRPFCIALGCNTHEACGSNACCTGREGVSIHACVPKACFVDKESDPCPPIPGSGNDGGAGTDAAAAD